MLKQLSKYWTVKENANLYPAEEEVSVRDAIRFIVVFVILALAIFGSWSILVML